MAELGDRGVPAKSGKSTDGKKEDSVDPRHLFAELKAKIRAYMPEARFEILDAAYEYAETLHAPQKRKSGDPYIIHPVEVASIIADLQLDLNSVIAALLHDTVEDTHATLDDIRSRFGDQVAQLVDGLTKIAKIEFRSKQEKLAENFRKMIVAMAKDLRVILIKLADRLHNMRTLVHMPLEKGQRIAQETLDIYAPLANRLGIYGIKSELEDLCLRTLKNDVYRQLREKVSQKKSQRQAYIEEVVQILDTALRKYGFKQVAVYGRPKHFYSIYKKLMDRRLEFEDLHDLFAFRIIVDNVKDCYEALGVVHSMWKPMPGRFKDYIAMPKANMYQSLHTTVIRPNGEPIEVQIRTKEMHEICEFGVAAHWSYKEKGAPGQDELKKFSWLRQIVQWQTELKDPDEFLEAVRVDLFDEEIFVFTPRGDVISLPQSASALDFAFAVHTNIGTKTVGAKVNGRLVPIKKKLNSGDIVEIITSPNQQPTKDWLGFVTTSKARNKIRSALRSEQRDKSKTLGREMLLQELAKLNISADELEKSDRVEAFIRFGREAKLEDVMIAIGYGKINPYELISKVFPEAEQIRRAREAASRTAIDEKIQRPASANKSTPQGVLVSGLERVLVNFAKCCHPLPGEEIIGFITRGRGVSVHRAGCARALDIDPHRKIDVSWASQAPGSMHSGYIRVICRDEKGVLAKITETISSLGANIQKADIRTATTDMTGILDFELGISGLSQLQNVINRLEAMPSVVRVERRNLMKTTRPTKKGKG
jgi:guanosine-3',5'-bis(diphosphate) 3'-pyrophosphohydrolase